MSASISHALRLAEGIDTTPENYRTMRELIKELRELAAATAEQTLVVLGITEQARMRGKVAGVDK